MNNEKKEKLSKAQMKVVRLGGNKRPIATSPYLNKIYGVAYGLFYHQLLYWEGKQERLDRWIKKTKDELYGETGLTEDQQDGAVRLGVSLGFLESKRMTIPATRHLRIDVDKFLEITASKAESKKLVAARYLVQFTEKQESNIDKSTHKITTNNKTVNYRSKKDATDIATIMNKRYQHLKDQRKAV